MYANLILLLLVFIIIIISIYWKQFLYLPVFGQVESFISKNRTDHNVVIVQRSNFMVGGEEEFSFLIKNSKLKNSIPQCKCATAYRTRLKNSSDSFALN